MLEDMQVECPYCGEDFATTVDCLAGSQRYIEDCPVYCRPIEFQTEVDGNGNLLALTTHRDGHVGSWWPFEGTGVVTFGRTRLARRVDEGQRQYVGNSRQPKKLVAIGPHAVPLARTSHAKSQPCRIQASNKRKHL